MKVESPAFCFFNSLMKILCKNYILRLFLSHCKKQFRCNFRNFDLNPWLYFEPIDVIFSNKLDSVLDLLLPSSVLLQVQNFDLYF